MSKPSKTCICGVSSWTRRWSRSRLQKLHNLSVRNSWFVSCIARACRLEKLLKGTRDYLAPRVASSSFVVRYGYRYGLSAIRTILYAHIIVRRHFTHCRVYRFHLLDLSLLHASWQSSEDVLRFIQHGCLAISPACVDSHAVCPIGTGTHNLHLTNFVR